MSRLETKPGPAALAGHDAAPFLRAEKLHRTYKLGKVDLEVLRDCNLSVSAGEFVAIMGRSGSGKSTLLHVLGALDVPQRGQVTFADAPLFEPEDLRLPPQRIRDLLWSVVLLPRAIRLARAAAGAAPFAHRRHHLRRNAFGFVFQFYHLLPELNVLENVLLPQMVAHGPLEWPRQRSAARQAATAILDRVGLGERLRHRPNELSGGERQRVAIARALVNRPKILLADEPTGNLDAGAGRKIMELLSGLHAEGQTIVMVTHDPGVSEFSDRVLHLEQGRLGSSENLQA